jgi:O-succinylbenzoic acid--CoA ligase
VSASQAPEGAPLVAIALPRAAAARAIVAAWERGEAVAPLDPQAPPAERSRALAVLRPTHLQDGRGRVALEGGVPAAPGVAAVVTTSGTTGTPKAVELTAAGIRAAAVAVSEALGVVTPSAAAVDNPGSPHSRRDNLVTGGPPTGGGLFGLRAGRVGAAAQPRRGRGGQGAQGSRGAQATAGDGGEAARGDAWLCCLPLHGVAGLAIIARAWHTGVPVQVHDRFEPERVLRAARDGDATLVSLVPTMLARLLDLDQDPVEGAALRRFRRILLGGAPAPAALLARARAAGLQVVTTYGLTETFGGVVHDGHPLRGVALRLDEAGQILVRGPMVMRGYRADPDGQETTTALRPDGWLCTGDLGRFEDEAGGGPPGRLRVLGRLDDLIVSGGVNVQPVEVEAVLATHPAVADAAVRGVPDPEWGERVAAYVVPADPAAPPSLEELRRFARGQLAAAKLPRELVLVHAIPRSPGGKILRRLLGGQR